MKRRNLTIVLLLVCLMIAAHSLWRASIFSRNSATRRVQHKLPPYLEGKTRKEILKILREQKKQLLHQSLDKAEGNGQRKQVKSDGSISMGCSPVKHYFLLKTHKCASTTVQNILMRYAWQDENLVVMLPAAGNFFTAIGWPRDPKPHHLMPHPENKQFDVLANHIVYDRKFVKTFLKPDALSFGLLREPFDHFMSFWGFFAVKTIVQKTEYEFLDNPFIFDAVDCSYPPQGPLPLKNFQAVQFGLKKKDMLNETTIQQFLKRIGQEFSLVIIKEYLDESLVLLMRILCWDFKDIFHYKLNAFKKRTYGLNLTEQHINNYRNWSAIDYKLYDYFNKTLWKKIREAKGFDEDLAKFRELNQKMNGVCTRIDNDHEDRQEEIGRTRKNTSLTIDGAFCRDLSFQDMAFTHMFANRQYPGKDPGHFSVECCRV